MATGQMRDRVVFQEEVNNPDGQLGNTTTWADVVTRWCRFREERGGERLEQGRLESPQRGTITVRSDSVVQSITTEHRAVINTEPFQIRSIANPDRRNKLVEMVVERGVGT